MGREGGSRKEKRQGRRGEDEAGRRPSGSFGHTNFWDGNKESREQTHNGELFQYVFVMKFLTLVNCKKQ